MYSRWRMLLKEGMYPSIQHFINQLDFNSISLIRKKELNVLVDYMYVNNIASQCISLNFICTHNSRRSQFSQVWAAVAASHYQLKINSLSGGVAITSCNERTIASLLRFGFIITKKEESENPIYELRWDDLSTPLVLFSKLYDDQVNTADSFAAIMTCSDADKNCPFIPQATIRIPLRYKDPKRFDNTTLEAEMYDKRSLEIATELFYVFSTIVAK